MLEIDLAELNGASIEGCVEGKVYGYNWEETGLYVADQGPKAGVVMFGSSVGGVRIRK